MILDLLAKLKWMDNWKVPPPHLHLDIGSTGMGILYARDRP
jgi:hypothetical protein